MNYYLKKYNHRIFDKKIAQSIINNNFSLMSLLHVSTPTRSSGTCVTKQYYLSYSLLDQIHCNQSNAPYADYTSSAVTFMSTLRPL